MHTQYKHSAYNAHTTYMQCTINARTMHIQCNAHAMHTQCNAHTMQCTHNAMHTLCNAHTMQCTHNAMHMQYTSNARANKPRWAIRGVPFPPKARGGPQVGHCHLLYWLGAVVPQWGHCQEHWHPPRLDAGTRCCLLCFVLLLFSFDWVERFVFLIVC